jgi:hypothetical protein
MRIPAALATFAAAAALACVVAYWGWQIVAPAPVHIAPVEPANPAATIIAANVFGGRSDAKASNAAAGALLGNDTRLIGIVAERSGRGYALFRGMAGPRLVAAGDEIAAGVTLVSIDTSEVTIRDGAGERRMPLRSANSSTTAAAANATKAAAAPTKAAVATSGRGACGPPAGFGGTVVRLNTELMSGISADSAQWNRLLAPVEGGLVVREDNGFAAMLGLKVGDRLAQANGIALGVPDDVTSAIVRPLVGNQGVRLIGSRNGLTHDLWLANVACAG